MIDYTASVREYGPIVYKIADGRFWSVDKATFIEAPTNGARVIILCRANGAADEAYLKQTLRENGMPIGIELLTLEEVKAAKYEEINTACDAALAILTTTYPERELLTFERQEREARALIAGDRSDIAHITAIADARGITVDELAQKIIAKADTFSVLSGTLIGHRQALETQVEQASTKEDVVAIKVDYIESAL